MNIGIVIQARKNSKRLPRKIYADLNGKYSIQRILEGCKKTIVPTKIILAMPREDELEIKDRINKGELNPYIDDRFELFIGNDPQDDLVDRYYGASRKFGLDVILRITADCPIHCATFKHIDEFLMEYLRLGANGFMCNSLLLSKAPFPCGIDLEVFSYEIMCWTKLHAKDPYNLEHCTPLMYSDISPFPLYGFENNRPHTMISTRISDFSLDTPEDYELLKVLTANYDKYQDLNKAIENTDIGNFRKSQYSKNFRQ